MSITMQTFGVTCKGKDYWYAEKGEGYRDLRQSAVALSRKNEPHAVVTVDGEDRVYNVSEIPAGADVKAAFQDGQSYQLSLTA
jgi:hypothetical protein